MAKTLSLSEVKTRLPELIAGVQEREEEVVVTKNDPPAAIPLNGDEYTRPKEMLDVLGDPAQMKQINRSQTFYRSGKKGLTFEDVFGGQSHWSRSIALRESFPSGYPSICR